jgi:signal transduction histidine kinase
MDDNLRVLIVGGGEKALEFLRAVGGIQEIEVTGLLCLDPKDRAVAEAEALGIAVADSVDAIAGRVFADLILEAEQGESLMDRVSRAMPQAKRLNIVEASLLGALCRENARLQKTEKAYRVSQQSIGVVEGNAKKMQNKISELSLLSEVARLFGASLDPRNVVTPLHGLFRQKFSLDATIVFLTKKDHAEFVFASNRQIENSLWAGVKERMADASFAELGSRVRLDSALEVFSHAEEWRDDLPPLEGAPKSLELYPLKVGKENFGYLGLMTMTAATEVLQDRRFFETVAAQLAVFVQTDWIKEQILATNTLLVQKERKLNEANGRLRVLNKELEDFTYTVSHELKGPLRGMEAFSKFLLEGYQDKLDGQGQDYLIRVRSLSLRLRDLVNDLLELSRITREHRPQRRADLNQVVRDVLENLRYEMEECRARVQVKGTLPVVTCNELRVAQVFQNLISNALKYTQGAAPKVQIACVETDEEFVLSVRDWGVGVAPGDESRIFGIFQRGGRTEKLPGTGAGLAICKKVVGEHGGRIWVEPAGPKGSIFYFTLPTDKKEIASDEVTEVS